MVKKNILFVLLAALLLAACAPTSPAPVVVPGPGAATTGVTVGGRGQVNLEPNVAYITIGVRSTGSNVSEVVAANAGQVSAVMAALADAGVAQADMQTSNFNVYASDSYDPLTGMPSGTTYSVENTVNVTARDLANLGQLLDSAVSAGANSIWGVSFDVDDKSAPQAEARDLAIADAIAEAQAVAAAAGVTLGDIVSITYVDTSGMYYPLYGMGGGGGAMTDQATSIVPGRINVAADVTVTFAIR